MAVFKRNLFFVTRRAYHAKLRLRDNPPLERTAAAVCFFCGRASRVRRRGRSTAFRWPRAVGIKMPEPKELAAWNNAVWCDAVCRAHGRPGTFREAVWVTQQPAPPYFPNAITLRGSEARAIHAAAVQELIAARLPGEWAIKDSFCTLELHWLGFSVLFEAEWVYRPASRPRPDDRINGVHWIRITEAKELAAWEAAWGAGQEPFEGWPRLFPDMLLTNGDIAVIAGVRKGEIVAGAVGNRTGAVVGLSNLFLPREESRDFWAGCLGQVIDIFPGLPIVGYDRGEILADARETGFEVVGHLRVWNGPNAAHREKAANQSVGAGC